MAGPTPVSALIHAATMVTAGVYLLARINPVLAAIADVGAHARSPGSAALTALFAATIAVAQNDIKKVLAYSTVSQLGYMFLAVGVGRLRRPPSSTWSPTPSSRRLLFLGSGSVIHGMHDEQDMRRMGGLRKFMPITAVTFIDRLAGHRRRPAVLRLLVEGRDLAFAYQESPVLWAIGSSPRCSPPST